MTYAVKEIFYTLQGEGANAGRPAVFCRFAGCNLWTGREEDRAAAVCQFCDTDFVGTDGENGGKFRTAAELAAQVAALWPQGWGHRFVVCTGGEPLLQLDSALIEALHAEDFILCRCPMASTGFVSVPKPMRNWWCAVGMSLRWWCRKPINSWLNMRNSISNIFWSSLWMARRAS